MKKAIIIIAIVVIFLVIIVLLRKWLDMSIMDKGNITEYNKELRELMDRKVLTGKLTKIRYSDSGNMNGNVYEIEIDIESLLLKESNKNEISDPLEVKEYSITEEDITNLENIIEKYNLPAWSDLEYDREMFVLDASIPSLTLIYDNKEIGGEKYKTYTITHYMKFPDGALALLNDFEQKIFELRKEEKLVREYIEEN